MLNRITVTGRLTADPELKKSATGTSYAKVTLACDRDQKDKDGNRGTDFIDAAVFGKTAEFVAKYFRKGQMATADGRLQISQYVNKDGEKRRSTEILADRFYFGDAKKAETKTSEDVPEWVLAAEAAFKAGEPPVPVGEQEQLPF